MENICKSFFKWDEVITKKMSVCSDAKAPLGTFRPFLKLLEYTGHGVPWLSIVGGWIIISHQEKHQEILVNLLFALLVDLVLIAAIKVATRRERPAQNGTDQINILMDKYSFPSGHASRAIMTTCFIIAHFEMKLTTVCLLIGWALSVSISRILLGRHHVSDVSVGFLVGLAEFILINHYIWLPRELCLHIIRPIQEELHL